MPSVIQEWVHEIPIMQQSVLFSAIRGPDTLPKEHVAKFLLRWYRRCILVSAMHGKEGVGMVVTRPNEPDGGSFTGPACGPWTPYPDIDAVLDAYINGADDGPHHFYLHLMHASQILGYHHPTILTAMFWKVAYHRMVKAMHVQPETREQMMRRLR